MNDFDSLIFDEAGSSLSSLAGTPARDENTMLNGFLSLDPIGWAIAATGGLAATVLSTTAESGRGENNGDGDDDSDGEDDTPPPPIDTVLTFRGGAVGGDGVVNAREEAEGILLSGTVLAGSSVVVSINGIDYNASVNGSVWEVIIQPGDLPQGEYEQEVTVTATDEAGNKFATNGTFSVDTALENSIQSPISGDGTINEDEAANGLELSGRVDPGSVVVVTINGEEFVADIVDDIWTVSIPPNFLPPGRYEQSLTVFATDDAGNTSEITETFLVDTGIGLTLDRPVTSDDVINADELKGDVILAGAVDEGATVVVSIGDAEYSATVEGASWFVAIPAGAFTSGEYEQEVTITASDVAGNVGVLNETLLIDTVASLTLDVPVSEDGFINGAELTRGVTLSGTVEPGSAVVVEIDGRVFPALVEGDSWSAIIASDALELGVYDQVIKVTSTDAAGNTAVVSQSVRVDTDVSLAVDSPIIGDDVISTPDIDGGLTISGTSDAGAKIAVSFAGASLGAVANAEGLWSVSVPQTLVPIGESVQSLTITATDLAGNVTTISGEIEVDTIVSSFFSDELVEGDDVVNRAEADDGITLGGTVEPGSTVDVTFQGTTRAAWVSDEGEWTVTFTSDEVQEGEYEAEVLISATDSSGNTSMISDIFLVDTIPPDPSYLESFTITGDGLKSITIANAGEEVEIFSVTRDGGVSLFPAAQEVDLVEGSLNLDFEASISDGSQLVVNVTDVNGNSSATFVAVDVAGTDRIDVRNPGLDDFDIEAIDLQAAFDADLALSDSDLESLSEFSNMLTIHGGADDTVRIVGAVSNSETSEIAGKTYVHYDLGDNGGTLIIDETINVIT
ncbi:hypothetical protein JQU17_22785 [Ponticoccus sp. SC2-23]|uniref:Ig-like domain-containing protein n=1 Tax=Alexandriicola marinus TaxID=2081710 RepID=UPI000FD9ACD1|nr:Ig-like domain-containing protein [Alexandriicola marinus]MBM1223030.1 hypothetical protein [Ponticoccus sp. SC6-9]MBM1227473.1 hypothetical protein [Ponticoccus sp. SC6-15]MBM1231989.1 hypothetical protein [Ponticoccus sp. SC6-38]MBM1241008.1 hypothetical protein [Ponticoccus sp. SC6-49]MBM1245513.1 hypothetical protein [Ponticoccus sp. SC2-64]MBM1254508.1 hypothetical protein [Ponticoccus sp. SC6-33]MBM1259016.1 hypothetical protein [Ponticoccus sp. SC6-60]MBM1263488.1 hypothetical pro